MTNFIETSFLKDYFFNGVNVVGNASSLQYKDYGSLIDSRKTIRFNWPRLNEKTGTRLDCLICSLPIHIPKTYQFDLLMSKNENTHNNKFQYVIPNEFTDKVTTLVDSQTGNKKPSNGILCLALLDRLQIKNVNIFGFDWKETSTTTRKPNKKIITKSNDHDYESEKMIALDLIQKNSWSLFL